MESEAEKYTGKISNVEITESEPFAKGSYGSISVEDVEIRVGDKTKVNKNMIVKTYENGHVAQKSADNYSLAKQAGIKNIPTTYRVLLGTSKVVMTNLNQGELLAVSTPANNLQNELIDSPLEIEDIELDTFENLLKNIESDLLAASKNKIEIVSDSFFFLIPKKQRGKIKKLDFIIGDFDQVGANLKDDKFKIYQNNLTEAGIALDNFLDNIANPERKQILKRMVDQWIENHTLKVPKEVQ